MAASLSMITSSSPSPWTMPSRATLGGPSRGPSASLSFCTSSATAGRMSAPCHTSTPHSPLLHSSFLSSSASSALSSSISGLSWGLGFSPDIVVTKGRRNVLVVRASKYLLCQTKRNRSRKSLARTHGFRRRMRTTSGRAVLKRRRAKGRKVLCSKSNPNSGKRS